MIARRAGRLASELSIREYACGLTMRTALPSKPRTGPRLVLQPASRRAARHTSTSALKRFFAIADAWELSPLQQCRLLKIPSPQVLERYRLGQAPRLSATQQERAALIANIQYSLTADALFRGSGLGLGALAPRSAARSRATVRFTSCWRTACRRLREVARLLVRENEPR